MNIMHKLTVQVMLALASVSIAAGAAFADPNISKQQRIQNYRDQGYGWARINALERQREKNLENAAAKRRAKAKAKERVRVRAINRLRESVKRRPIPNFELRRSRRRIRRNRYRGFRRYRPTMRRFGGVRRGMGFRSRGGGRMRFGR
jgi:hypothetical protein